MQYTFRHADGNTTTISANSEAEAREAAMTTKHGPTPQLLGRPQTKIDRWRGDGLHLISVREESPR